jgi:predicted SnoaL-like aldol condensation-catalyzing enzyme
VRPVGCCDTAATTGGNRVEVEQNKAVVRRFLDEVVGRGAFDVASELSTEDWVNHAAVPLRQRGIQNIKAVVEFSRSAQPDQRSVERQIIGDGDLVVVYGRREGTWQADSFRGTDAGEQAGLRRACPHVPAS